MLLRVERESLNQSASREKLQAALATLGHGIKLAVESAMWSTARHAATSWPPKRASGPRKRSSRTTRRAKHDARLRCPHRAGTLRPA
jgi:hypothetical protein